MSNSVNGRDRDNMLRDNFTLFDIPNIVGVEDTEPFTGLPGPPEWLRPDLRQAIGNLRPMPDPPPFRAPFLDGTPVLGRPSDGGHVAVLPGGISAAVGGLTSSLVSADLAAIVAGTRRQIVAVEPGAILRPANAELDGVPQWVSLPTELSPSSLAAPVLWSKAGTMITLSEVVRTDCRPIELAARWESMSYPGEIAFPSERTYRVPDRVTVTSGEAVPGGRVELVFERDDFETCRYAEEQGEYRLEVCTNGIVGSAFTGDDIVVDAMHLRIIDGATEPFEVRATIEEQPPCGAILPPDPRVSVSAAGDTAPLADAAGAPTARTAYAAAYSGLENAVYVVGGVTPEGDTTGPVVRWDLGTNRSRYIAPEAAHAPSDRVLGVAYSPLESVLYVLDVVREVRQLDISGGSDRGGHPSTRSPWWPRRPPHWGHSGHGVHHRPPQHFGGRDVARLYRYDIEKGTSARLATWPYKGLSTGAHLMLLEGGELALVVGRRQHMEAFLFQDAGDHLERRGSLRRHGVLAAPPVMGNHDPVVALLHDGRIEYVTLELSSFRGGERCDDL